MLIKNYQIRNEEFLKNKENFKLLFLTTLQSTFAILWISFFAYGFSPQFYEYSGTKLAWLPEAPGSLRGVGIFLLMWFLIIQFILAWKLPYERRSFSFYFNWTLVGAFVSLFVLIKETDFKYFNAWVKDIFASDPELKQTFHRKSWQYILVASLMVFMIQAVFVALYVDKDSIEYVYSFNKNEPNYILENSYSGLWFGALMFFTNQTNLLCFFFTLLFTIKPSLKIFRNNSFLMYCVVYITVVGLVYNCVLLPPKVKNGQVAGWTSYHWYANVIQHILDPILFAIVGLVIITNKRGYAPTRIDNHMIYGMSIPFVYLTFATFSSIISAATVYGSITNLNSAVLAGNNISSPGHIWRIAYFPLFLLVFAALICGIYYLDKCCANKYLPKANIKVS